MRWYRRRWRLRRRRVPRLRAAATWRRGALRCSSTTRKFGGSGLGLTTTQRPVGMMGGKITLESVRRRRKLRWSVRSDRSSRIQFFRSVPARFRSAQDLSAVDQIEQGGAIGKHHTQVVLLMGGDLGFREQFRDPE